MEFWNSIFKSVNERLTSPLYGAFILAIVVWNYDIFLTIFLVSNESIVGLEKMTKAIYIRDVLYPTIWGIDFYSTFGDSRGRIFAFMYHVGIPAFLTYLMVWHLPKLGDLAHKKEKEFYYNREVENFNIKEKIAEYKLQHSGYQDAVLEKEENDAKRKKTTLDLISDNKSREIKIKDKTIGNDGGLSTTELGLYTKITTDSDKLQLFRDMLAYVHIDNEDTLTVKSNLGLKHKEFERFKYFYSVGIISFTEDPENENWCLYFQKLGKNIILQMQKDGYLKEEDLEGKI